jgi:hypothetical protein
MSAFVLKLTMSERMALLDIISAYARNPNEPQSFINCSTPEPCEETTTGDILLLVSDARFEP